MEVFTSISSAIEEARRLRAEKKNHFAVRQSGNHLHVTYLKDCMRPLWSTLDDYRFEMHGISRSRVIKLEPSDAPLIIGLLAHGLSQRQVADKFDVTRGAIRKLIKRAKAFGTVNTEVSV